MSKRSDPPTPEQLAKLDRQRIAAEEGAKAMKEVADKAIAIRENMVRLRGLRLAREAIAGHETNTRQARRA